MEKESLEFLVGQGVSIERIAKRFRQGPVDGVLLDEQARLGVSVPRQARG
jgi:hypothetical protein